MNFRELADTGISLPEIGIGTWQYRGGPALLRKAVEFGASLIDTAELYGNEEVVAEAIRGIKDRVFVATKTNHWRRRDVVKSAETSIRKLGVDCIDLYQLHYSNAAVPMEETISAMEDLVDQGKVRFLGVCNFCVREIQRAQAALRRQKIVSNQVRYSIIERTIESHILPYCQASQITIIAYSPLGYSYQRILDSDPHDVLGRVAREMGKTRAQVALNWCIRKPGLVAIPKTDTEEHLAENCRSSGWTLTEKQIKLLSRMIRFRCRSNFTSAMRRLVRDTLQRIHPA